MFCNNDILPKINWDSDNSDSDDEEHIPADDTKSMSIENKNTHCFTILLAWNIYILIFLLLD